MPSFRASCLALLLVGCASESDPDRTIGVPRTFSHAAVLDAHAAHLGSNGWERVCDGSRAIDGLVIDLAFITTRGGDVLGKDSSLRPGDVVDRRTVGPGEDIDLARPGALRTRWLCLASLPDGACSETPTALITATPDDVDYVAHTAGREVAHDVRVIVDRRTLVTPAPTLIDSAVDTFVASFDANDHVTTTRLGPGDPALWDVVLAALDAGTRPQQLVVLGDCDACASGVRAKLATLTAPPVVHVLQLDSLRHGRDPDQVAIACMTGGHYGFIDTYAMSERVERAEALDQALLDVRFALMGAWQVALAVPSLDDALDAPVLVLSGVITVTPESHMLAVPWDFPFGVGQGVGAASATTWDRRLTLLGRD